MNYEPTPLSNVKMPKIKLIAKLVNSNFRCYARKKPPTMNHYILNVFLF